MSNHSEAADSDNLSLCIHCNATFKSKTSLDDHTIREHPGKHPDFIESISSKIHECTHCTYKTTVKGHLTEHMVQHTETADIYKLRCIHCDETFKRRADNYKLKICVHCNAKFKSKASLDNHTVREHPDFVASVSNKLHECAHCTYKTTLKSNFSKHMWKHSKAVNSQYHPKATDIDKLRSCAHCDAKFKSKQKLDEHTLKKHPGFITSVSSKMRRCTHCTYITTRKDMFARHMLEHPETADSGQLITCTHCEAKFKSKQKLDEHTLKKHPDLIASVSSKIHECIYCTYKTTRKDVFLRHMEDHPEAEDSYQHSTCIHCNAVFKRKRNLDDHIVRKHPDFIAFVSSKIHECTHCSYRTAMKANLDHHMLKHPETADSYRYIACVHCNATYKTKKSLDDHTIRKHPDSITCITSKIYQCKYCTYKTTRKSHFVKHSLVHPETVDSHKLSKCIHCNAIYKHKIGLDDHILRQHPELIASVSSKMHECTHCAFKTVLKANLALHMLEHHETADRCKFSTCVHCNTTFIHKQALSDHILTKHPESIGSVSSQIYECTLCAFRTVSKPDLDRHMVKHPETEDRCTFKACVHCNATFKSKTALNDHTLKKHPESIGSVSSKNIYECTQCSFKTVKRSDLARHMLKHPETANQSSISSKIHQCKYCTYKTTWKSHFARHMLAHPETADSRKLSKCIRCNTEYKHKIGLDEHILRQHPELIASVSNKMHECTHCAFKTVFKDNLTVHMVEHHETADICKFSTCVQCNATFKSRQGLNDHTLKKHPESIGSISSKIYECPQCTFKTVMKSYLTRHMLKHPETADRFESNSIRIYECTHCAYKTCLKRSFTKHILKHP
nr:unnamed protein product [Callosobruchus analis]